MIDWAGPPRQTCPSCGRGPKDRTCGVTVEHDDSGVAHCFRCEYVETLRSERPLVRPIDFEARAAARREQAQRDETLRHQEAAMRASVLWEAAQPAPESHPYLARKQVRPHGTRVDAEGRLLVPMYVDGQLVNVQRVAADGTKRFLTGGRTAGAIFTLTDCCLDDDLVYVAEGFATAATVHFATALPVVVAFSAGNLVAAARAARRTYPDVPIVIAADNDQKPDGSNPGVEAGQAAAVAVCGALVHPGAPGDWNDIFIRSGWSGVTRPLRELEAAWKRS